MFPAAFDYSAPTSLEETLGILQQKGDEAKVLAGGQSLIPLLKLRFATPALVVDIGRIDGLEGIGRDDGTLRIGARTRHADVETRQDLRGRLDAMLDAAPQISDPLVRNQGTVGGSLCHADPAGDWGAVMLALDAELVARSATGMRHIPIAAFFDGPFTTTLRPDELVTEVVVPIPAARAGGTYCKLERKVGDFATVGVAVHVELGADGAVSRAGIGLCAVGPTSLKATAAEQALVGQQPSEDLFAQAARLAAAHAEPRGDYRGSVEYKRDVVRVFVQRGLRTAVERARSAAA